jgi:CRP-like cAMP-binding protein
MKLLEFQSCDEPRPGGSRTLPAADSAPATVPRARRRGATSSRGLRGLVDLRAELHDDGEAMDGVPHPLPARTIYLPAGEIDSALLELDESYFGVMVLDGLLLVEHQAGRARIGWMMGEHDLIVPSASCDAHLTDGGRWRALTPACVAVLDREFALRARHVPQVTSVLLKRVTTTANWLLAKGLVAGAPTVVEQLLLVFRLYGERWGRVTADGVLLRLPLTHAVLALVCGARRPSVTLALHALERDGSLRRTVDGAWLLRRTDSSALSWSRSGATA